MKKRILLEEAQELLLNLVNPVESCSIPLFGSSGRILSTNIKSIQNLPLFDRSPLDGYAMRAIDIKSASADKPVKLKVIEEIAAGYVADLAVTEGTTIKVMTGAPIPHGADVVIKYEDVNREDEWIDVFESLKSGNNIIRTGEDVAAGEIIAEQGTMISPSLEGLLAGIGIFEIPVYRKTQIAILSTGDELLNPGENLAPGKIYNSNMYSLGARCRDLGTEPIALGTSPDQVEIIGEKILAGLDKGDMLITSGGVSVGDFDLVQQALQFIGAEIIFWQVAIKPGSPIIAAIKDGKLIIGLSGNPASSLVTFDLIAAPVIKKISGYTKYLPTRIEGILGEGFKKSSPQRRFLRGSIKKVDGMDQLMLTGSQGNAILKSMLGCNVLIDVPEGSPPLTAGQNISGFIVGRLDEAAYY